MKKIKYIIPKREKCFIFLLSSILLSYININLYPVYLFCFFGILCFILEFIVNHFIYVIKIDEEKKFIISSPLFRIISHDYFYSITNIIITSKEMILIKDNNTKYLEVKIPFINGGFMHEDDFLYIMGLFKDIEIEYINTTQEKVLELISKQSFKHRKIITYIGCICALFILLYNLFVFFSLFI